MKLKLNKKLLFFLLITAIITQLTFPLTIGASNAKQKITYHRWAGRDLFEGERFGIIPPQWYNNMQAPVDEESLNILLKGVRKELSELNFESSTRENLFKIEESYTREEVLKALYNEVAKYKLPSSVAVSIPEGKDEAIYFMRDKKILRRTTISNNLKEECTLEMASLFASRLLEIIYIDSNSGATGFLWKATNEDNVVYLLGSLHLAKHDAYPFSPKMKKAFINSDKLVVEANIMTDKKGLQYMQSKSIYTDGTKLEEHISEELYSKVEEVMKQIGLPKKQYNVMKPWALDLLLDKLAMQKEGGVGSSPYSSSLGIDTYFLTNALYLGKPIEELEGIKFQADLFESFSKETQEKQLADSIEVLEDPSKKEKTANLMDNWLDLWVEGNVEKFEKSYTEETRTEEEISKEYYKKMFPDRDKKMIKKVKAYLNQEGTNTYFVITGAGHMIGETGIIKNLKEAGYEVSRVK